MHSIVQSVTKQHKFLSSTSYWTALTGFTKIVWSNILQFRYKISENVKSLVSNATQPLEDKLTCSYRMKLRKLRSNCTSHNYTKESALSLTCQFLRLMVTLLIRSRGIRSSLILTWWDLFRPNSGNGCSETQSQPTLRTTTLLRVVQLQIAVTSALLTSVTNSSFAKSVKSNSASNARLSFTKEWRVLRARLK